MADLRPVAPAVQILRYEGWELKTMAFFHEMDDQAIKDMLPVTA